MTNRDLHPKLYRAIGYCYLRNLPFLVRYKDGEIGPSRTTYPFLAGIHPTEAVEELHDLMAKKKVARMSPGFYWFITPEARDSALATEIIEILKASPLGIQHDDLPSAIAKILTNATPNEIDHVLAKLVKYGDIVQAKKGVWKVAGNIMVVG